MIKYFFINIFLLGFFTSCSLAPFSANTSGRSYGQGQMQAEVGNSNSSYYIKYGLGASDNLDAGFVMEFGDLSTSAIFLKYSFINNPTGPSVAGEFGYGSAGETSFYYVGSIASLAFSESFEMFINGRINSVSTNEDDVEKEEFNGNLAILAYDVNYLQLTYGMNLWMSEVTGLALYWTHFKGDDIETSQDTVFGASLMFRF